MTLRELRPALLAVTGAFLFAAVASRATVTEDFKQSYPLAATGSVHVETVNGSVEIVAWDKNEVALEAEKRAPDAEDLQRIHLKIESTADRFSVKTEYEKKRTFFGSNTRGEVRYKLHVPSAASLKKIEVVNARVSVEGVKGSVEVEAVNGTVNATGLTATAHFETVNGNISAEYATLPASGRISFETVNGTCRVHVPVGAGFHVEAETVNGHIECDQPITLEKSGRRNLRGQVGTGGPQISLESVNGALHVTSK